jgi:hypothetical protein
MSKVKSLMVALAALSVLAAVPAFAQGNGNAGCKNGKFVGSYTSAQTLLDLWGDGSNVDHTVIYQLNLHSDGTADQYWTGFPDLLLSGGTGSPFVGSWTCRKDGTLVVTFLTASYVPTPDAGSHGIIPTPPVDLLLVVHDRFTYLFSVTDGDTLTRIQLRRRQYSVTDDPSDPTGGTLFPLNTAVLEYKRLVASDADLLAP